jgi:hypothetical protein
MRRDILTSSSSRTGSLLDASLVGSGVEEAHKGGGPSSLRTRHDHLRDDLRNSTTPPPFTAVTPSPFRSTKLTMAPTPTKDKYSVLLPTYNERRNLPIITWLLNKTFTEKYVAAASLPLPHPPHTHTVQPATSTGSSSLSTTALQMARKKLLHNSKKPTPRPRFKYARAPAN